MVPTPFAYAFRLYVFPLALHPRLSVGIFLHPLLVSSFRRRRRPDLGDPIKARRGERGTVGTYGETIDSVRVRLRGGGGVG